MYMHVHACITGTSKMLGVHALRSCLRFWEQMHTILTLQFCQCNFAFAISLAVLHLQFCISIRSFPESLGQVNLQFCISRSSMQFSTSGSKCSFTFSGTIFYQQFANHNAAKAITRRQIPAAIPETISRKSIARRTLFLQVLLTTCPLHFPTRISPAPFAS